MDEMLKIQHLRVLEYCELELMMTISNAEDACNKTVAKHRPKLDVVRKQIAEVRQELYWSRLSRLIHTPCWKYRVIE